MDFIIMAIRKNIPLTLTAMGKKNLGKNKLHEKHDFFFLSLKKELLCLPFP